RRGYESKYEEDQIGEELGDDARVWRVLLDEGSKDDARQFQGIRDHLDVDLVFSGLFAAVVTTFVVQSSQALQPDNAEISANLLFEMIAIQRAVASGSSVGDIAASELRPGTVTASSLDYWVNRLWYLSLLLGLFAAFLAFIVRGWLYAYDSDVHGSPRRRALVQHYRRIGLNDWKVDLIVLSLPTLLHASMLLFFIGLALDLRLFDASMAYACTALIGSFYSLHLLSVCLPVFYPQCPYRSPLSAGVYWVKISTAWIYSLLRAQFPAVISLPRYMQCPSLTARAKQLAHGIISLYTSLGRRLQKGWAALKTTWKVFVKPSDHEWDAICQEVLEDNLVPKSLDMAFKIASDPSVTRIVVQATSGFPHKPEASELVDQPRGNLLRRRVVPWFRSALTTRQTTFDWTPGRENDLQRMACALLLVPLEDSDTRGPHPKGIDTEQYCVFLSRVIQGLMSAIASKHAADVDVPTLSATILALGDRLDDLDRQSRLLLDGALLKTIATAYSPLVNKDLRVGLSLHPAVWHHMRRYLGYLGVSESVVPCPPFAVVLWRSYLIIIYRLLCPASCSGHEYTELDTVGNTVAFENDLGFLIVQFLNALCTSLKYGSIDSALNIVGYSTLFSFFKSTFLALPDISFVDAVRADSQSNVPLPPNIAVSLSVFFSKLAAAVRASDHPEKQRATRAVICALDHHVNNYHESLTDPLADDVVSIERLHPVVAAVLNDFHLALLGLTDVLATTLATHLSKLLKPGSDCVDQDLEWGIYLDVLCASRLDSGYLGTGHTEASSKLHSVMLLLKKAHQGAWKRKLTSAFEDMFIPLSLAFALRSQRGLEVLADLVDDILSLVQDPEAELEVCVPDRARDGEDMEWYRRCTSDPDKHIHTFAPRPLGLHISELVTFEEAGRRLCAEESHKVAQDGGEAARGDSPEEYSDDGAHDAGSSDGAEGKADRGDAREGIDQSGLQASFSSPIAAGWKWFQRFVRKLIACASSWRPSLTLRCSLQKGRSSP
ncbi:hypothetical protein FB107DRAFT_222625, partial [Schizophyllum commune]